MRRCNVCGHLDKDSVFGVMVPNESNPEDKMLYEDYECPDCLSYDIEEVSYDNLDDEEKKLFQEDD